MATLDIEIVDEPFQVVLYGFGGPTLCEGVGASGKRHMDNLWREVREKGIKTKGINHWVYLPNSTIFTGVELVDPAGEHGQLQNMEVKVDRYLRHVHRGDYALLAQVWPQLFALLQARKETPKHPNLEIYGHWNADSSLCETTILIGLV